MQTNICVYFGLLLLSISFFGKTLHAQQEYDTLYLNPVKQWTVKYYLIRDTTTGAQYKVSATPNAVPLQFIVFNSENSVLEVEAHQIFPFKKLVTYIKLSSKNGEYLWLFLYRKKVDYTFRKVRWGII